MSTKPEQIADVLVAAYHGLDWQTFSYALPVEATDLKIGSIVQVPFGKRSGLGIVTDLHHNQPSGYQLKPISKLINPTPLPAELAHLVRWLQAYYVVPLEQAMKPVLPSGIGTTRRKPYQPSTEAAAELPSLNTQQHAALKQLTIRGKHLLYGVTGSGKTMVYAHLIQQTLQSGQSALLMLPEIVLAESLNHAITKYFPQAIVLHSGLRPAERLARWQYILENSPDHPLLIVGTRSALFAPIAKLGCIIVDEAHEPSYKQDSGMRYHGCDVAAQLSNLHQANLVFGSATPSLNHFQLAQAGRLKLVKLTNRHANTPMPAIEFVHSPRGQAISEELRQAITDTLAAAHQVILLHNRRGSARSAVCTSCGELQRCPSCEVALTYHADIGKLICHYCGRRSSPPAVCSACKHGDIRFVGFGTKAVVSELREIFPKARIARLDTDSARTGDAQALIARMHAGDIDILVGTQMIGRGLDFDKVSLAGIISAESALAIPDYSASERAFDLMVQAAGRAGRRHTQGQVIVQTYNAEQPLLQAVAQHSYEQFATNELALRRKYLYPPYAYLVQLECGYAERDRGQRELTKLKSNWASRPSLQLVGPVAAHPFGRGRRYYWQLVAKSRRRAELVELCKSLPPTITHNLDPINLL
jgi:primosomal protein N' (replication factor Y)